MKRFKSVFFLIILLFSYNTLLGNWVNKAPLNVPRGGLVCEVVNGRIYAISGRTSNHVLVRTCEEYDPQLDRWMVKESIPTPRYGAMSSVIGNKIYVIGGDTNANFNSPVATNIIEAYDPIRDTWEIVNSVWPFPRSGAAGTVIGDWIYVMGGVFWGQHRIYFDTVEAYNPILNQWVVKRSMNSRRAYFDASVIGNRVNALAGENWGPIKLCEAYDTIINTWDSIRSLPNSLRYHAAVAIEDKIFVIGGSEGQTGIITGKVYYYQPNIGNWSRYNPDLNQARYRHGAVVIDENIYVIGGKTDNTTYIGTVEQTTFIGIEENDTIQEIIAKNIPTFIPAGKPFRLNKNWQLFDAAGRKINSTNLNRGLYFLLIKEENVSVKKIVVY